MIKVAVTGGIGSGKSLVCEVFEKIGIPVFNADQSAKDIMDNNNVIKEKLISYFGTEIYDKKKKLIRKKFAEIIFKDKLSLSTVNEVVHPAVRIEFEEWANRQNTPYVIEETAIVFESGQAHLFDKIIAVTAPLEIKINRVMSRDKVSRENVLERINNQFSDKQINEKSDFIIVNDNKEMILPQIINIHNKLI